VQHDLTAGLGIWPGGKARDELINEIRTLGRRRELRAEFHRGPAVRQRRTEQTWDGDKHPNSYAKGGAQDLVHVSMLAEHLRERRGAGVS
jgi:hypothetical protein